MLSATQARAQIPDFSIDQIRLVHLERGGVPDDLEIKTLYLGNLCAGDLDAIKELRRTTDPEEFMILLNEAPHDQWNGTALHMALYWNTGDQAKNLFHFLVEHGAEYTRDG